MAVAGNVALNSIPLTVTAPAGFTLPAQTQYIVLNVAGTLTGTFQRLPEGAQVGTFGVPAYITYRAGDGNDIALYSQAGDPRLVRTNFTTSIRSVTGSPFGITESGGVATGYFQYDRKTEDVNPSSDFGDYPHAALGWFELKLPNGKVLRGSGKALAQIEDSSAGDKFRFQDGTIVGSLTTGQMAIDGVLDADAKLFFGNHEPNGLLTRR